MVTYRQMETRRERNIQTNGDTQREKHTDKYNHNHTDKVYIHTQTHKHTDKTYIGSWEIGQTDIKMDTRTLRTGLTNILK